MTAQGAAPGSGVVEPWRWRKHRSRSVTVPETSSGSYLKSPIPPGVSLVPLLVPLLIPSPSLLASSQLSSSPTTSPSSLLKAEGNFENDFFFLFLKTETAGCWQRFINTLSPHLGLIKATETGRDEHKGNSNGGW